MIRISFNKVIGLIAQPRAKLSILKQFSTEKETTEQGFHANLLNKMSNLTGQNEVDFNRLTQLYSNNPRFDHFLPFLPSTLPLHQHIIIFKTFKVMQEHPYVDDNYHKLYEKAVEIAKTSKTDNLMLLIGKIKVIIAKQFEKKGDMTSALQHVQEALNRLEECVVPPVLQYYQTYRYMGCLMYKFGMLAEAKEVLSESVQIIDEFIAHSDDPVSSASNTAGQAIAYTYLATLQHDSDNRRKWLLSANEEWKHYPTNVYDVPQYALTICQNLKEELKTDRNKAQGYYFKEMYMLREKKEMKELVEKVKNEWQEKNKEN